MGKIAKKGKIFLIGGGKVAVGKSIKCAGSVKKGCEK